MIKSIIEFLFPSACPLCGTPVSIHGELCSDCWSNFNWISGTHCVCCGYPFPLEIDGGPTPMCPTCASGKCELDWIRSACVYDDVSRSAVLPFKHSGRVSYAKFMSRAMMWALRDVRVDADIVMPIPLSRRRLFHRAYNQATLLARPIASALSVPMDVDSVRRSHRRDMGHLNARQRAQNIHNVFTVVRPDKIRGRRILLVDDVMTTGATFAEMRRVLMRAGATAVYGVTFCRVARAI